MVSRSKVTDEMRKRVCALFEKGKTNAYIASILRININTVSSMVQLYRRTGRMTRLQVSGGRKRILSDENINFIRDEILNDVLITLKSLKQKLQDQFAVNISISSLYKEIDRMNYSFKKVEFVPEGRNVESAIITRKAYATSFSSIPQDKFIFIDETGVNVSMRLTHGRAPRGQSPRKSVRAIRSVNYSIVAAITNNSMLMHDVKLGAFNGESFSAYISSLISTLTIMGKQNMVFVMDNATIHRILSVRSIIENAGHTLMLLPPYTPQLNPIELVFSKWKGLIKAANCISAQELSAAITDSANLITSEDCSAYFSHMLRFIPKAMNEEPF